MTHQVKKAVCSVCMKDLDRSVPIDAEEITCFFCCQIRGDPIEIAKKYSKGGRARLQCTVDAIRSANHLKLDGDFVECGVWMGGHVMLARMLSPDRRCWLYDTFEGMPPPGPHDIKHNKPGDNPYRASAHMARKNGLPMSRAPIDQVMDAFRSEGLMDDKKMRFVPGLVEATLLMPENLPDKISVLRLDTDWHDSTKMELEVLYPRLQRGGYLIIDDFGHWEGARKATKDYFAAHKMDFGRLRHVDYTCVYWIKGET